MGMGYFLSEGVSGAIAAVHQRLYEWRNGGLSEVNWADLQLSLMADWTDSYCWPRIYILL
jgi:hypothetical protein